MLLTPAQMKPKSFESRRNSFFSLSLSLFFFFFFFFTRVDASHVNVLAWVLGCFQTPSTVLRHPSWRKVPESDSGSVGRFHSLISTQTFRMCADCVGGQPRGDKECPGFSGITKSGRVWRKVPESDAWSVIQTISDYRDTDYV